MSSNPRVVVYSSPTCSDCNAGKKFLTEHNIDYVDHDVSQQSEADALKKLTGKSIVPTFVINDKILYGFAASREEIEGLLLKSRS
ncbi:glutaredoxin family protein [Alicyclobacillus tolerans]|uniref:glutaredoxin family protein n=1 Tax=Alicyclobacillus tolerans TaxID=90970 RepID=UPI001F463545|nr:glutaredoxin family protein [Alicyclobacillus tolerans]MCF8566600.1 glutaredoxin family protein [Alicyclobacillus tolerans]